jgi:hypothetical protein
MDSNLDYVLLSLVSVAFLRWAEPLDKEYYKLSDRFILP